MMIPVGPARIAVLRLLPSPRVSKHREGMSWLRAVTCGRTLTHAGCAMTKPQAWSVRRLGAYHLVERRRVDPGCGT